MSRLRSLSLVALFALVSAPFAQAEHPRSDERDRSGYDDRDRYPSYRDIHAAVHDALARALGPEARDIRVVVQGRTVHLSGSVRNARSRAIAHDAAHEVRGVRVVSMRGLYVGRRR